tara:strand:+ start:161 stop:691 length:531 start_codon:yes stop_codon:yes gene_type:complete
MTSQEIEKSLLKAGFEPDEIPALLGNIDVETGGTFDFRQIENTTKEQKGYGLFQFTGGHLSSYLDYLKDTEQEDSVDAQTKFVYSNIYDKNPPHVIGAGNQKKIQKAFDDGSFSDKSDVFARWYERFEGSEDDETIVPGMLRGRWYDEYLNKLDKFLPNSQAPSYNERIKRARKYD